MEGFHQVSSSGLDLYVCTFEQKLPSQYMVYSDAQL